jgi:hypothetical protein
MAILSPKPEMQLPLHFFSCRLTPLAVDIILEKNDMSHISIAAAGLNKRQIDDVDLEFANLWRFLQWLVAYLSSSRGP